MISPSDLDGIRTRTAEFWREHSNEDSFSSIFQGKEIGHRVADYVDETTVKFLSQHFSTAHELDPKGNVRSRSMGDFWIKSGGMYNPVNIKAGEYGQKGQPNLVSLTKLINGIVEREIDSYYLLFVKTERFPDRLVPHVYLVDMLDYLPYVTFDFGPGQTMLKESQFFEIVDNWVPPTRTLLEKLQTLFELLEDGLDRLIANRQTKMDKMRKGLDTYQSQEIPLIDQKGLRIG